jgi:pimeloyl-ACP methyl ester carboxylesterase
MKHSIIILFISILASCNAPTITEIDYGSNQQVGKYMDIDDIRIYYEIYGEGIPLLLFHGNGGSIQNFEFQIPELSKHFKVIAVDSRAQGRSTDSNKEITYDLMASDMNELINKLNLDSVSIFGWSDGGNIGLELAYAHPEKIKKLVTLGANYTHINYIAEEDSVNLAPNDPMIVKIKAIRQKRATKASVRLTPIPTKSPETQKKLNDLMENYPNFTEEQLTQIKIPTMVVVGDHDLINLDHAVKLSRSLPHSELFVVPGATHVVLWEQPELINSEIIKFIKAPFRDFDRYYIYKIPK